MRALKIFCIVCILFLLVGCTSGGIHSHEYGGWEIEVQPTCTSGGVFVRSCGCGHKDRREISALTHSYDKGVVINAPTCTERGLKSYTCKLCGQLRQDILDVAAHTVSDKYDVITKTEHAKTCLVCSEAVRAEKHYFYGGKCVACNASPEDLS